MDDQPDHRRVPSHEHLSALSDAFFLSDPGTGIVRARLDVAVRTLSEALAHAVSAVEQTGLRVLRIDSPDWVTCQDIADRVGRSREAVRLWAAGRLGPGGFPPPLNPGRDTSFYSWAEVLPWLREHVDRGLPDDEPVLAAANLVLQFRNLVPRLSDPAALWRLAQVIRR
jgi:hypothetical protein